MIGRRPLVLRIFPHGAEKEHETLLCDERAGDGWP